MKTKGEAFAGLTVALVTPFRDGAVDLADLKRLVQWHIEQGTDCLSPVGTRGEGPPLAKGEQDGATAAGGEQAAGGIKFFPGPASTTPGGAFPFPRAPRRAGCDGVLMVGPYYNKPTQEGYFRHFAAVA